MILAHLAAGVSDWAVVVAGVTVLLAVGKQSERQEECVPDQQKQPPALSAPRYQNIPLQCWHVNGRKS